MRMSKLFFTVIFLVMSTVVKAQYAGYSNVKDIDAFKTQFAAASQKINSIKADFEQEKNLSCFQIK